jgi:hypothetical protein
MSIEQYTDEERKGHKREFVNALRSGKYKQTFGIFEFFDPDEKQNCYCAVGLARMIKRKELSNTKFASDLEFYGFNHYDLGDIIQLNDGGKDFQFIANWIEEKFL